jgi:single-strand DNA-binding protein
MNNITIAGNVGKDAVVRSTGNGDKVAGFSVAVNEGKDRTTWFSCSLWGDRAEKLAGFITKGSKVAISGSVSAREYDGKALIEVRVGQISFLGGGQRAEGGAPAYDAGLRPGALDDEIPF